MDTIEKSYTKVISDRELFVPVGLEWRFAVLSLSLYIIIYNYIR